MPLKLALITPCAPTMSSLSEMTREALLSGFASLWKGKSAATRVELGAPFSNLPLAPGLSVFLIRLSVPALKWHVAQATNPSPPVCMSQKKAFPSRMAALLSLTKSPRWAGLGTDTVLRDGGAFDRKSSVEEVMPRASELATVPEPDFPQPAPHTAKETVRKLRAFLKLSKLRISKRIFISCGLL